MNLFYVKSLIQILGANGILPLTIYRYENYICEFWMVSPVNINKSTVFSLNNRISTKLNYTFLFFSFSSLPLSLCLANEYNFVENKEIYFL